MENHNHKNNKEIAIFFLTDSVDFLKRYTLLREKATHIGLRSKLLIELIFSLECILKSVIFYESNVNEKETYKKIKKKGHNINKLADNLSFASKEKFDQLVTKNLEEFEIYHRYMIEIQIDFRDENGALREKYYETIDNFKWLDNIYEQINDFITYSKSLLDIKIEPKSFADIDLVYIKNKWQRLIDIRK